MNDSVLYQQAMLLQNRERILPLLKKYPHVISVGVGVKETNQQPTDAVCYRVYVTEKKKRTELAAEEIIPSVIEGFSTDVLSYGIVEEAAMDTTIYRPLKGGIQIKNDLYTDIPVRGGGTLGCLAYLDDGSNQIVGLTNQHVVMHNSLDNEESSNKIGQPWRHLCCCCCEKNVIGTVMQATKNDQVDCASIEFHEDIVADISAHGIINEIAEIGNITGIADPQMGTKVKKRGAATGVTYGYIADIAFDGHQILISPLSPQVPFANFGDSGSVVVDENNRVIGLLWATKRDRFHFDDTNLTDVDPHSFASENTALKPRIQGVATPIAAVQTALGIKIPAPPPIVATITLDPSNTTTHAIPSTLPAAQKPLKHFVTVKGDDDILLSVSFDQPIDQSRVKWVSDNDSVAVTFPGLSGDNLTAKVSKKTESGDKAMIGVTVDGYGVGDKVNVWIIWCKFDFDHSVVGDISVKVEATDTLVTHGVTATFAIAPKELFSYDIGTKDRPDLRGANTTPPPSVPDTETTVYNHGVDLSAGAASKWDASTRVRCKSTHSAGIFANDGFNVTYPDFPSSPLAGNYDNFSVPAIDGDPYADDPSTHARISHINSVSYSFPRNQGIANDTVSTRIDMQEFARVELDGHWYIASDPYLWSLQIHLLKASEFTDGKDYDGDGVKSGDDWIDHGTETFANNDGF